MKPDTSLEAAAWWERHLESLAAHERDLGRLSERRAGAMALSWALITLGLPILLGLTHWWAALGALATVLMTMAILLALAASLIFWAAQAPLDGRRFRGGSLASWLHGLATGGGPLRHLQGFLPTRSWVWRENLRRARRTRPELSAKVHGALEQGELEPVPTAASDDARLLLCEYLQQVVGSDLSWWLEPGSDDAADIRRSETRVRQVFWFWLNRQAAQLRADLLAMGMRTGQLAVLLLVSALAVHLIGWWLLPLLLLAVGIYGAKWYFGLGA